MFDSLRPHRLYSPWNSPGQNTGVGRLPLLQGIFPTQGSNPGLPHCRQILYQLSHKGSPRILEWVAYPFCSGSSWPRKLNRGLQYFGHLMQRVDSLEKTLMLGGIGGRRRRGWQRRKWLDGITDLMDMSLSELQELMMDREGWGVAIHGVTKNRTRLSYWTELNSCIAGRFFTNWAIREAKVTTKNKKLISTNKRFSKIAGYKINIRKVIVFPYTWIL